MLAHDSSAVLRLAPLEASPRLLAGLVGRARELSEVESHLSSGARFVSITGPGGSGKTRLARAVARRSRSRVIEVDASALTCPMVDVFAAGTPTLLVLDSIDRFDTRALASVSALLEDSPELTILATSRRRMTIDGGRSVVLGPLAIDDAVELFIERGRAISADETFAADREPIAELARRLDANPLAIELAASRLLVLSPSAILDRLDTERFRLLESDRTDVPARQRSLAANICESWRELSPSEQRVLEQCAVLGGGFTFAEAEASIRCEGGLLLDVLQSLVTRSLLVTFRRGPGDDPRFSLDESVRAFALEFGSMSSEERRALAAKCPATTFQPTSRPARTLAIDADRRVYKVDGGPIVSLSRRRAPWLVLEHLAKARLETPGRAIDVEELSLAGWPGEKILPGAAAARVYFVIRELRKTGLEEVLVTIAEGYLIDASVRVAIAAAPPAR